MALWREMFCYGCNKRAMAIWPGGHRPSRCVSCQKIEDDTKESDYYSALDALSLEDRVRRLERSEYERTRNR